MLEPLWIDATPERISRALSAGLDARETDILSPSGQKTGVRYRQIDNPVETALSRGWIRERHYAAGMKFFETMNAGIKHPRVIAQLDGVVVDGTRGNDSISDHRAKAQAALGRAVAALPPKMRDPFFSWAFRGLSEDISVAGFGAYFSRAQNLRDVTEVGKRKLLICLGALAKHYGF